MSDVRKIGAHVSMAGGLARAEERAAAMGCNCLQIFSGSPRGWDLPNPNLGHKFKLSPVYFHATYLINLADGGETGGKSKKLLIAELNLAAKLGIRGSVVHLGSYKTNIEPTDRPRQRFDILLDNLNQVLSGTDGRSLVIIENSGNKKIGQSLDEIQNILDLVNNPRLRVCLDTCHLHAARYKLAEIEKVSFLDRLELIHVNDSKDEFGSGHDRHENIGQGMIGLGDFRMIMNSPKLNRLPFILEVPGFDNRGPDAPNVDILKSLIISPQSPG